MCVGGIKLLPFLLIGYFLIIPYSVSLLHEYGWRSFIVTNNFLLLGIPMITIGWNLRSLKSWKVDWKIWALLALVFTAIAIIEARWANKILHSWIQLYFSTIPQTVCIMMASLTFPQDKWRLGWLSIAGRKYSTYIYIFHTIWISNKTMLTAINDTPVMTWFVFFSSLIIAVLYVDCVKPLVKA